MNSTADAIRRGCRSYLLILGGATLVVRSIALCQGGALSVDPVAPHVVRTCIRVVRFKLLRLHALGEHSANPLARPRLRRMLKRLAVDTIGALKLCIRFQGATAARRVCRASTTVAGIVEGIAQQPAIKADLAGDVLCGGAAPLAAAAAGAPRRILVVWAFARAFADVVCSRCGR